MQFTVQDFKLSESFIEKYKTINPAWGIEGEFTYYRTYSRKIPDENRNEVWWETVRRVVEGAFTIQKQHCVDFRLPWKNDKAQRSAQIMYDKIFNFKFLPPGRGLWMMGTDFVKQHGSSSLMNCAFVSTEDILIRGSFAFTWTMDALMLGVGVGFDIKGAGKKLIRPVTTDGIFIIPDSREGWVESVRMLLDAYFDGKPAPTYDYSLIRPYGAPIRGFGGVASGARPLIELHEALRKLLDSISGGLLSSANIVDIMNLIGVCVVAGNVRRSAEACIGDWKDEEYINLKNPLFNSDENLSHRWVSNNSVFAEVGKTDYKMLADLIARNGEPGIVWLENIRKFGRTSDAPDNKDSKVMGLNPCFEQPLESGECCCLVETFPSLHDSYSEYEETLKSAYLYAKTVNLLPTEWAETNAIMLKNRRIGTSQSGIIDAFVKHGRRTMLGWSEKGYQYLKHIDKIYSDWLCVPLSIRLTSVKPSGTVSLLPGVSPGVHYHHSKYYIRRIRVASNNPLANVLKAAGYHIEDTVYGNSAEEKKMTSVVSFPVKIENFDRKKTDISIWEQVKNAVDLQRIWSDNAVSITVTFKPEEAKDISRVLEAYEDSLKAISFLPLKDHGYAQAPYEEIDENKYNEMIVGLKHPDYSSIFQSPEGEEFCTNDGCSIK